MELKCPKCESSNINQYRMLTGFIWCESCGYKSEQKEVWNLFTPPKDTFIRLYKKHKGALDQLDALFILLTDGRKKRLKDFAWELICDQRNNEGKDIELKKEERDD